MGLLVGLASQEDWGRIATSICTEAKKPISVVYQGISQNQISRVTGGVATCLSAQ